MTKEKIGLEAPITILKRVRDGLDDLLHNHGQIPNSAILERRWRQYIRAIKILEGHDE